VPLQRDEEDERLARVDQIIADLRQHADRLREEHRHTLQEARLLRERSEAARRALRKLRLRSRPRTPER